MLDLGLGVAQPGQCFGERSVDIDATSAGGDPGNTP